VLSLTVIGARISGERPQPYLLRRSRKRTVASPALTGAAV